MFSEEDKRLLESGVNRDIDKRNEEIKNRKQKLSKNADDFVKDLSKILIS